METQTQVLHKESFSLIKRCPNNGKGGQVYRLQAKEPWGQIGADVTLGSKGWTSSEKFLGSISLDNWMMTGCTKQIMERSHLGA